MHHLLSLEEQGFEPRIPININHLINICCHLPLFVCNACLSTPYLETSFCCVWLAF